MEGLLRKISSFTRPSAASEGEVRTESTVVDKPEKPSVKAKTLRERTPDARERVQLQLSPEAVERLRFLRESTDATSNAEVFRKSLQLYEWILDQLRKGYRIRLVKDDEEKDVELVI
jgi:hypothetical protein